jgi:membrane-associated phospholipid phosphatase
MVLRSSRVAHWLLGFSLLSLSGAGARAGELHNPLAEPGETMERLTWRPTTIAMLWEEPEETLPLPNPYAEPPGDGPEIAPAHAAGPFRRPLLTRRELGGFLLGTVLLAATDRTTVHWLDADLRGPGSPGDGTGQNLSRLGTGLPILFAVTLPAAVDGRYGRRTSALAAMALVNSALATEGLKYLTGRERPWQSGGEIRFHGPGSGFHGFPSGHTAAAVSVATVLGSRYRKYRLPLYLLAAGIGWARVNAARHFPSDVFVAAGIGIYTGRYVLRHGARILSLRF